MNDLNGTALPVSARDTYLIPSSVVEGLSYRVCILSYRQRTRITSQLIRDCAGLPRQEDLNDELRATLQNFLEPAEAMEIEVLLDMAEEDPPREWTKQEALKVRRAERMARKASPEFAALFAERNEWNRWYNWLFVKHVLRGFEGHECFIWESDGSELPSDDCMDQIPDADFTHLVIESRDVSTLTEETVKNSELP